MTDHSNALAGGKTMKRRLTHTMLTAALVAAPLALLPALAPASAQTVQRPARDIVLSIGRGELVTVPGKMSDVFVANEQIADVQVKSTNQLYVFGKAGGETTVYASNSHGDVVWSANVRVGSNIDSVDQMLHLAMPDAKINVATMNGTVLLTGIVAAPEDAAEAERLTKAFVGDKTNVISRLKMATPLQVNLQVRFAEVSRSLVRDLGANLATRDTSGGFLFGVSRGTRAPTITGGNTAGLPLLDPSKTLGYPAGTLPLTPFNPATGQFIDPRTTFGFTGNSAGTTALNLAGHLLGMDVATALDIGEKIGLVTTLSQPNLTALSGETADFLAGGEYPIPISQGLGTTAIEYKRYGVSLSYTPTVLANGRISIRVRPEVSELSSQGAVTLNGFQVPALTIRRAETTVELGSGQSFMIAGLMSNSAQHTIEKAPGLGDMPILGTLFRSTNFQKGETELVIVVTPYLVNPVNANDIKLPTDGYQSPNEIQQVLGGMDSDGKSGSDRPKPTQKEGTVQGGPKVGVLDTPPSPSTPQQSADAKPDTKKGKRSRGSDRQASAADAAAPGFSLN
ncbi:type II and III secretion system protein family protein [Novosphingobium lentum]|uniref:type II and III secretion system protein family protein n=1 Tax=Novosphingobium lentum TaxID=145287 RepID=UPI00083046E1|nr:type II and III secretion system protein family protein [Novosphingobium lentum]